ncbi:hypothetical protein KA001_03025, partial [Patescibacteria group bacterium]|nr:hypothetical protein [Patescibacteria group bacterium]
MGPSSLYGINQLWESQPNAVLRNDLRIKTPDDRHRLLDKYGNVCILSPDNLSYWANEEKPRKASILITPLGRKILLEYPGLLKNIGQSLYVLENELLPGSLTKTVGETIFLQRQKQKTASVQGKIIKFEKGRQSKIHILEVDGKKMIVKTAQGARTYLDGYGNLNQPYVDEMLQIQTLQT